MACAYMTILFPFPVPNGLNHIAHLEEPLAHPVLQTAQVSPDTLKTVPEKLLEMKQYGCFHVSA